LFHNFRENSPSNQKIELETVPKIIEKDLTNLSSTLKLKPTVLKLGFGLKP